MKKKLCVVLAVLLSLSGCGKADAGESTLQQELQQNEEITTEVTAENTEVPGTNDFAVDTDNSDEPEADDKTEDIFSGREEWGEYIRNSSTGAESNQYSYNYGVPEYMWIYSYGEDVTYYPMANSDGDVTFLVDSDNRIVAAYNRDEVIVVLDWYEQQSVVSMDDEFYLVTIDDNENVEFSNISDMFPGETVKQVGFDRDGLIVWTAESVDTATSHDVLLFAKRLDGTILGQWDENVLNENIYTEIRSGDESNWNVDFLSWNIYRLDDQIWTVCNGYSYLVLWLDTDDMYFIRHTAGFNDSYNISSDNGYVVLAEYGFSYDRMTYMDHGEMIACIVSDQHKDLYLYAKDATTYLYHEGDEWGLIDNHANTLRVFEQYQYNTIYISGDDYAAEVSNGTVDFVTMMDENGEALFEPIQGTMLEITKYANDDEIWFVDADGNYCVVNRQGEVSFLPEPISKSNLRYTECYEDYFYARRENQGIFVDYNQNILRIVN
jgi:hypothetical protein